MEGRLDFGGPEPPVLESRMVRRDSGARPVRTPNGGPPPPAMTFQLHTSTEVLVPVLVCAWLTFEATGRASGKEAALGVAPPSRRRALCRARRSLPAKELNVLIREVDRMPGIYNRVPCQAGLIQMRKVNRARQRDAWRDAGATRTANQLRQD